MKYVVIAGNAETKALTLTRAYHLQLDKDIEWEEYVEDLKDGENFISITQFPDNCKALIREFNQVYLFHNLDYPPLGFFIPGFAIERKFVPNLHSQL